MTLSHDHTILRRLARRVYAPAPAIGTACVRAPGEVRARLAETENRRLVVSRSDKDATPPRRVYFVTAEDRRAAGIIDTVALHRGYDSFGELRVASCELGPGAFRGEQPVDFGAALVALLFPGVDLAFQSGAVRNAAIDALGAQHADLDLHHVEPNGVLRDVMELEAAQDAASVLGPKSLVECAGGTAGQVG